MVKRYPREALGTPSTEPTPEPSPSWAQRFIRLSVRLSTRPTAQLPGWPWGQAQERRRRLPGAHPLTFHPAPRRDVIFAKCRAGACFCFHCGIAARDDKDDLF